jgi:hypothetical protein
MSRRTFVPWTVPSAAVGAVALWIAAPESERWVWAASALALLAAAAILTEGVRRAGWTGGALSPAGVVSGVLFVLFAVRPVALVGKPTLATPGLAKLGFSNADLVRATSIGVLGLVCFSLPLLALLPARRHPGPPRFRADGIRSAAALVAAALVGTALWITLFVHAGGFHALAHDPAQLHLRQFGGIYGTFGLLLCLTGAVVGLAAYLSTRSRRLLAAAAIDGALGVAGSVLLASRGPLVATVLAVLVLFAGRLSRRQAAAVVLALTVLGAALAYGRTIRENAQVEPLGRATSDALHKSPAETIGGDQVEFDHLVALVELVPERLDWLYGRSIAYVPAAFVPRSAWPGKPLPIDYRLSKSIYGPRAAAGTPFTLPGELYWNFGAAGVTVGMIVLGLLAGLGWRALSSSPRGEIQVLAAVMVGFTYFLLTRPLAPMVQVTAVAAVATLAMLGLASFAWLRPAASKKPAHDEDA